MDDLNKTELARQVAQNLYSHALYTTLSRKPKSHDGGVDSNRIDSNNAYLLAKAQWEVTEADEYGLSFWEALCHTPSKAALHAETRGYAEGYADAMAGYTPRGGVTYIENIRTQLIAEGKW